MISLKHMVVLPEFDCKHRNNVSFGWGVQKQGIVEIKDQPIQNSDKKYFHPGDNESVGALLLNIFNK